MSKEESKQGKQIDLLTTEPNLREIVSGKKTEDYRNLTRFNINLLIDRDSDTELDPRKDISHVRFVTGYGEKMKYALCEINGIFLDEFINFVPEGMKPGTTALTIEIRQIVEHNL